MCLMVRFPLLKTIFSGRVQVALVWNSRNEKSQSSEKLNSLSNVSKSERPSEKGVCNFFKFI